MGASLYYIRARILFLVDNAAVSTAQGKRRLSDRAMSHSRVSLQVVHFFFLFRKRTLSGPFDCTTLMSSSEEKEIYAGRTKDYSRGSRFAFRKIAEYQLRQELKDIAVEKCAKELHDFAACDREHGFMVVWSCRSIYKELEKCFAVYNGEEAWQKFRAERLADVEKRARLQASMMSPKKKE